jgi:hypothetical protein
LVPIVWLIPRERSAPPVVRIVATPMPAEPQVAPPTAPFASQSLPAPPPPANARTRGSPLAAELNAPGFDAQHDVAMLHAMLRQYLQHLRGRPGHPLGNDSDLARVLTGHNPMKLVILPPAHSALTPDGRLRDRWGTPYFIHPRGHGAFEIRSAGPDRRLFTPDDAIENPAARGTDASALAEIEELPEP